jgi:hypothetical protein
MIKDLPVPFVWPASMAVRQTLGPSLFRLEFFSRTVIHGLNNPARQDAGLTRLSVNPKWLRPALDPGNEIQQHHPRGLKIPG